MVKSIFYNDNLISFKNSWFKAVLFLLIIALFPSVSFSQALVTVRNDAIVTFNTGVNVKINGSVNIGSLSVGTFLQNGNLNITGDWTNARTMTANQGTVTLSGASASSINGTSASTFYNLTISKSAPATVVSIDQNVTTNFNLSVQNGTLQFANTAARTVTIGGSLTITATNGNFNISTTGTARTHQLNISGFLNNFNVFDMNPLGAYICNTTFQGNGNSTVTGGGGTTRFNLINVNKGGPGFVVNVITTNFSIPATGALTLTQGVFKLGGTFVLNNPLFASAAYSIPANSTFWLLNSNVTITGQNGDATLGGTLQIDNGSYTVGTAVNSNHLKYSSGSVLTLNNGSITVNGRFSRDATSGSTINFSQNGGTFTVGAGTVTSADATRGVFDIGATASTFNWAAGTIELKRPSSNAGSPNGDYINLATSGTVSSGTLLRINSGAAGLNFRINSTQPAGELLLLSANNPLVTLNTNDLTVYGNITLAGTASPSLNANNLNLICGGNWNNNGSANAFTAGTGKVTFNSNLDQYIQGTASTTFNTVSINKGAGKLLLGIATTINGNLNLISSTALLDIQTFNITLGTNCTVFSNDGFGSAVDPGSGFTSTKCILYSQTGTGGGSIIRNVTAGTISSATVFGYPIGTTGVYTPARITIYNAVVAAGGTMSVKPVPTEHPNVQAPNISLRKYWTLNKANITFTAPTTYDLNLFYDDTEIFGTEGLYRVIRYNAGWTLDPGVNAVVFFNNNKILDERPTDAQFIGDWTAGEEQAARATYYSIANGNYSTASSWSKVGYGGTASPTAPTQISDVVYIGDGKTITLTANTPTANKITVQNNGTFVLGTNTVVGDTFRLTAGGTIRMGSAQGIVASGATGNVQTTVRSFDTAAVYIYNGTVSQATGTALPATVRSIVVDNTGGTVTLGNNTLIGDSLVINNGTFDIGTFTINGTDPGRNFIMRGGQINIGTDFPTNYTPPTFTAGTINFNGTSALSVPSSGSSPGVNQYNNLTLAGNRKYNTFTFESNGEIRIGGIFSIGGATFAVFPSERFLTSGSTIVFNGSGAQSIPRTSGTAGSVYEIKYFNLKISGTGTKSLINANHDVQNHLFIGNGATFALGGFNLNVNKNWVNNGGTFTPGANTVTMATTAIGTSDTITSAGQSFYNLVISGPGEARYLTDMSVSNNLTINAGSTLATNSSQLTLLNNYTNNGTFSAGTGTVMFSGGNAQTLTNCVTCNGNFYNLIISKSANSVTTAAASSNITVNNNLTFDNSNVGTINVRTNSDSVTVYGSCIRSGNGYVDGCIRLQIPVNANSMDYHVGNGASYTPATIALSGTGGTAGLLGIISNTRTVSLTNSGLNTSRNVERQWEVVPPSGSTFALGGRTYSLTPTFINPGDIRGGANPLLFETRRWDGGAWNVAITGNRTTTATTSLLNSLVSATNTFVVGEPTIMTYYSIANGNWTDVNSWSTARYGGEVAPSAPVAANRVYIGDGKTISLTGNISISDSLVIEVAGPSGNPGRLNMVANTISGAGFFTLRSGGILGIGSTAGISAAGATGNVQSTGTRAFNTAAHYIYNGSAGQVTGSGLTTAKTLTINNAGNTITASGAIVVSDSINIQAGTFDVSASNFAMSVGGNWRNAGTFTPRNGTVTFNGSVAQNLTNSNNETFYNLTMNKSAGSLVLVSNTITVNNTLTFTSGNIDARTNSKAVISAGTVSRTSGHVDGELRKNIAIDNAAAVTFEIGAGTAYTPLLFDVAGTGGTAGYIGAITYGYNHPHISDAPLTLDTPKNVQRYWSLLIPTGSTFVLGGSRTYDLTLTFINPDDIRGGANTANFVIKQWDNNLMSWNPVAIGTRTGTSTQATDIDLFGNDFVIGINPPQSRIFYTRADGAWNSLNTWSTEAYNGAIATDYPNLSGDIAFIGNANRVTLDQNRTLGSVTVESLGGTGTLSFGNFVLSGNQFILKRSGKLEIGSSLGITSAGATGNVQTTVRNYNYNSLNLGNFVYNGAAAQATGNGLPASLASLEVNNPGNTVTLGSVISVSDSIKISAGTFSCNNLNINLAGTWFNNSSTNAFTGGTATVTLNGSTDQSLTGTQSTTFNNLTLNKTGGNAVLGASIQVNGVLNFAANALLVLNNYNLTVGTAGSITGTALGTVQMIQSNGSASSGQIIKVHATGTGIQRDFTFPIGVGSAYNPATIQCNATFAANAQTTVQLRSGLHPNRVTGATNMLGKWWTVATTGISSINAANTNLNFTYIPSDVNGTQANYIPARYNSGWEVNLGTSRSATTSPITINQETGLPGDWTAGEPGSFFSGRIYFSRATGNWNAPASWSNISHAGTAAVYYPGQIFASDTVIIANSNTITFNVTPITIDSIKIGAAAAGTLSFLRAAPNTKKLTVLRNIYVETNGSINEAAGAGNRFDTLQVNGNFTNNNTTAGAVNFRQSGTETTTLLFGGTGNSTVTGGTFPTITGWTLSTVILRKNGGLSDSLITLSPNFSHSICLGNADDQAFTLASGVFRQDNQDSAIIDADAGTLTAFQMGANSGIDLRRGGVFALDTFKTNTNTTVNISTGVMKVGTANNEHFRYETGTTYTQSGGELRCSAGFTRVGTQSALNFNLSGGILRVMLVNCTAYGVFGFDIASANSVFNWSGGTVVITRNSSDVDYKVGAATFNVTGGTLQVGETGTTIGAGASIALGSPTAPIWNLYIKYTRQAAATYRSAIFYDGDFEILGDVTIDPDGCLDLNTNSFTLKGNFTNNGVFTPDGAGWNSGGGTKRLTLTGTGNQTFNITPAIAATPNNGIFQNEAFFDFIIDKPSGNVILGSAANSNLIVRNTLKFNDNNAALIDSRTNNKYVYVNAESGGDLGQLQRLGSIGHVDGTLRLNVPVNAQTINYPVGTSTDYTPVVFQTVSNGGTAGSVDCIAYGVEHPMAADPPINRNRDVLRYWRLSRPTGSFALGGRTFNVTTTFLTSDMRNGANWSIFEHFQLLNNTLPWNLTTIGSRTTTSTQSTGNATFNNTATDFVTGERGAVFYYSIANGNWTNPATWSNDSYGGAPASTAPTAMNHQVYIGDGKTVTLDAPEAVKLILVENAGSGPGTLITQANFLSGDVFTLSDGCSFWTANEFGIRAVQNLGAVRTTFRNYGNANYTYNSAVLGQTTGDGLPSASPIMSLTVNNTSVDSTMAIVFLTNDVNVTNDIYLQKGYLDGGNKFIQVQGNLTINNGANFNSNVSTFTFNNASSNQNITLNNSWGTLFNILELSKNAGNVTLGGSSSVNIFMKNRLKFDFGNNAILNTRLNSRKAVITTSGIVERDGNGYVDGILQKPLPAGAASMFFEIGNGTAYTPATLILDNTAGDGTAGQVDAVNLAPVPNQALSGNRMDPNRCLNRYWSITGQGTFTMGSRVANVLLQFPPSEMSTIELASAIMRRKSIPAEPHLYTDRSNLTWNAVLASVTLAPAERQWPGLGEFYIGAKAQRIFYSRANGSWDNSNNWSFTGFGGVAVPAGEFPNPDYNWGLDETEIRDSAIVGGGFTITDNFQPELAYLDINATGTVVITNGNYISQSSTGLSSFFIRNGGNLNLQTSYGIESGIAAGALRFSDANRTFEAGANYEFSGSQNQQFGLTFPTVMNNLTLNNDINTRLVKAKAGDITINGNLTINTGQLRPFDATTNYRLAGNLTVGGIFEGTLDALGNGVLSNFTFQGSGVTDQTISGAGTLNFANLTMNRGAGTGVVADNSNIIVNGILNLREGSNANNQIISIASVNNIYVNNTSANSIQNYNSAGPNRYIRTSTTSGLLIRKVTTSQTYTYPVGSYDSGADVYTPFTFTSGASGTDGKLGVRVSPGTSVNFAGGHYYLPLVRTTDWLKRYWAVDSVTTTINGQLRFDYRDADVSGNENLFVKAGRWTLPRETAGGSWKRTDITIDRTQNYFTTDVAFAYSLFRGDFTLANIEAFARIFFSRQTGNWDDPNSWTSSDTHVGPIYGVGQWPNASDDSVVIGKGNQGVGDHVITLDVASVTVEGVALGTSASNSGTLDCGPNTLLGNYFTLEDYSTLKIGSPNGISLSGATGNIQTTNRLFTNSGYSSFEYKGTANQALGNGLPNTVRNLTINNTGGAGNNIVTFDRNIGIQGNLSINAGKLDLQTYTANSLSGTGAFSIAANAYLSLSGTNNLLGVLNNFSSYNFNTQSITEFYGSNQTISSIPANLTTGLGNVITTNAGTKLVNLPLLIKGNIFNQNSSFLQTNSGVDALQVQGSVINSAAIMNNGVIEIGVCN